MVVSIAAASSLSASSEARSTGNACPMSHVIYRPYAGIDKQGLEHLPWLRSVPAGHLTAHLFFYGTVSYGTVPWSREHLLGARIFTTRKQHNVNPKVLWITRTHGYGQVLELSGRRLDAPGSFSSTYRGFGDYPSYVDIPTPGCWRVTVITGPVSGSVVFSATD